MTDTPEVIINGVRYVPVMDSTPTAKQIATALIERYMGKFKEADFDRLSHELQVYVGEDSNEPSVAETVAEIIAVMDRERTTK